MTKFKKTIDTIVVVAKLLIPIGWVSAIKEIKAIWK